MIDLTGMKRYTDNDTEVSSEAAATADTEAGWNQAGDENENSSDDDEDFVNAADSKVERRV